MKNYPGNAMLSSQIPQNSGYMISGTPEAGNMKLSLIPDEYAKHSNKERERRFSLLFLYTIAYMIERGSLRQFVHNFQHG